jgi:hypothetical protein
MCFDADALGEAVTGAPDEADPGYFRRLLAGA